MAYDLPSWLQADAPSEPFKALLAGAQVGTQIAQVRNQARAQDAALMQRRYEFDVEQQRQSEIDAVHQKVIDQQLELGRLNIKNNILAQEEKIKADRAISGAAKIFGDHQLAGIAGTDASEARIWSYISNNPEFYIHPGAKDFEAKVGLARQSREKASQFEDQEALRLATLESLNARKTAELESKTNIAEVRSGAQIESANISAKAKVDTAMIAAEKWKDHSRFAAFKDASAAIRDRINPVREPEKYAAAIKDIYTRLLPTGETNAWDAAITGAGATRAGSEIRPDVQEDTVIVISPSGKRGTIPRSQLGDALRQGYKEVP